MVSCVRSLCIIGYIETAINFHKNGDSIAGKALDKALKEKQ